MSFRDDDDDDVHAQSHNNTMKHTARHVFRNK